MKLSAEQVAQYEREGFLLLPGVLDEGALEKMRAECMLAWEAEKGPFDPEGTWLHNALLPNVHHRSVEVRDWLPNFVRFVRTIGGATKKSRAAGDRESGNSCGASRPTPTRSSTGPSRAWGTRSPGTNVPSPRC